MQVEADTLYKNWHQLPDENKRRIIEGIVERIEIKQGRPEIEITFSSTAPSEDMTTNLRYLLPGQVFRKEFEGLTSKIDI